MYIKTHKKTTKNYKTNQIKSNTANAVEWWDSLLSVFPQLLNQCFSVFPLINFTCIIQKLTNFTLDFKFFILSRKRPNIQTHWQRERDAFGALWGAYNLFLRGNLLLFYVRYSLFYCILTYFRGIALPQSWEACKRYIKKKKKKRKSGQNQSS